MTICLFVSYLAGLRQYYQLELLEKNEKMSHGPTYIPLNYECVPDHHLDTKNIRDPDFPIND